MKVKVIRHGWAICFMTRIVSTSGAALFVKLHPRDTLPVDICNISMSSQLGASQQDFSINDEYSMSFFGPRSFSETEAYALDRACTYKENLA